MTIEFNAENFHKLIEWVEVRFKENTERIDLLEELIVLLAETVGRYWVQESDETEKKMSPYGRDRFINDRLKKLIRRSAIILPSQDGD